VLALATKLVAATDVSMNAAKAVFLMHSLLKFALKCGRVTEKQVQLRCPAVRSLKLF
jgi:hypothetical protein